MGMIQGLILIGSVLCHGYWAFKPRTYYYGMTYTGQQRYHNQLWGSTSQSSDPLSSLNFLTRIRGGNTSDDDEQEEEEDDNEEEDPMEQEEGDEEDEKEQQDEDDLPELTVEKKEEDESNSLPQPQQDAEEEEDEVDEEDEEEEYDDEYDLGQEQDEEVASKHVESTETSYDEPFSLSPIQELTWTVGSMILFSKVNLKDPKIIQWTRFFFLGYILAVQIFLIYVRIQAKSTNDTTPITVTNPINSFLQSQISGNQDTTNNSNMVKSLANSLLTTQTTIVEYDLSQAKSMNMSLLTPMLFLWVLHFKFGQVQPLLFQTLSGIKDLVMSPLFQVYVWKRHLQRPFQNTKIPTGEEAGKEGLADAKDEDNDKGHDSSAISVAAVGQHQIQKENTLRKELEDRDDIDDEENGDDEDEDDDDEGEENVEGGEEEYDGEEVDD